MVDFCHLKKNPYQKILGPLSSTALVVSTSSNICHKVSITNAALENLPQKREKKI